METGTVFVNNRTQAVRLPAGTRFPDSAKKVQVRVVGGAMSGRATETSGGVEGKFTKNMRGCTRCGRRSAKI